MIWQLIEGGGEEVKKGEGCARRNEEDGRGGVHYHINLCCKTKHPWRLSSWNILRRAKVWKKLYNFFGVRAFLCVYLRVLCVFVFKLTLCRPWYMFMCVYMCICMTWEFVFVWPTLLVSRSQVSVVSRLMTRINVH